MVSAGCELVTNGPFVLGGRFLGFQKICAFRKVLYQTLPARERTDCHRAPFLPAGSGFPPGFPGNSLDPLDRVNPGGQDSPGQSGPPGSGDHAPDQQRQIRGSPGPAGSVIPWTRWTAGIRGRAGRSTRGAGFEGAGEGRSEVGRWQGGITNPVKNFSKIRNPVGSLFPRCTKSDQAVHSRTLWNTHLPHP